MKFSTKAYLVIVIILLQSLASAAFINNILIASSGKAIVSFSYSYPLMLLLNVMSISSIFIIYNMLRLLKVEKNAIIKLNHSEEVISALQAQKHDFHNHLSVLSAMFT